MLLEAPATTDRPITSSAVARQGSSHGPKPRTAGLATATSTLERGLLSSTNHHSLSSKPLLRRGRSFNLAYRTTPLQLRVCRLS
ncbi:hypothetical protein PsYK624_012750 [Phanerochaete sordida]|uniref:Uncharacterized protein n=1 Tax=Phanerochaete sordida TaxID=48140 RepID=A0A9P3L8Z8_9APHY|nr:hypothetical protein PsYK624_012750 [Phanerochaete sordida]